MVGKRHVNQGLEHTACRCSNSLPSVTFCPPGSCCSSSPCPSGPWQWPRLLHCTPSGTHRCRRQQPGEGSHHTWGGRIKTQRRSHLQAICDTREPACEEHADTCWSICLASRAQPPKAYCSHTDHAYLRVLFRVSGTVMEGAGPLPVWDHSHSDTWAS
jgi:hypothetical protein